MVAKIAIKGRLKNRFVYFQTTFQSEGQAQLSEYRG